MSKLLRTAVTAAALALALAPCLRADDSAMRGIGGSVQPMQAHPTIRMVSEVVRIENPANARVTASFVFRNEGPATDVLMGFPEESSGDGASARSAKLAGFQSWIDGKPAGITHRQTPKQDDNEDYSDWLVKSVHFRAGQTRTVVDTYSGGGGNMSTGQQWFSYVLTTGANWKGPIGHARIICDLGPVSQYSPVEIAPAGYHRHGNTITWDLYKIKPNQNINIQWLPAFANVRINGVYPWSNGIAEGSHRAPSSVDDFGFISDGFRYVTPVRRADDVWLPAKLAAQWLGASFKVEDRAKRVRVHRGSVWADVLDGSRTMRLSTGKTLTMPWSSDYEHNDADPGHPYTMASLRTLVTAFGGTMTYDRQANRMDIRMP